MFQAWAGPQPALIAPCVQSVRDWALQQGWQYRFETDALFDGLPGWFRDKLPGRPLPLSDLGRLYLARRYLEEGFERVIWLDADMLVFDPASLQIDLTTGHALGTEVWLRREGERIGYRRLINNGCLVFCRGNAFLDWYIEAIERIVRRQAPASDIALGPQLLTHFAQAVPMPAVATIGNFSPLLMQDLADGHNRCLGDYLRLCGTPQYCGNLCTSKLGQTVDGVDVTPALHERVLRQLLDSRGAVLNRHYATAA